MTTEVDKFRAIIKQKRKDGLFVNFFDNNTCYEDMVTKGVYDFDEQIFKRAEPYLHKLEVALEIGSGGGRLMIGACRYFEMVIGLDVHDENDLVAEYIKQQGLENFILIKGDGKTIPSDDDSIDLVYSFIVFQHMREHKVVLNYLKEIYRVLKKNGVAVIYFARTKKQRQDYIEKIKAPVNYVNIRYQDNYFRKMCEDIGFTVKDKRLADGINNKGEKVVTNQLGVTLQK